MRGWMLAGAAVSLVLAACGEKPLALPDDPIDKAASCGAIAATAERTAAGLKGDLSVEAQGRILHYALLAGTEGGGYDREKVNAVSQRQPEVLDKLVEGKWERLKPACAAAFPAAGIAKPELPAKQRDAVLQCDQLTGFLRKALGSAKGNYAEGLTSYGVLADKLSNKIAATGGQPAQAAQDAALAAAARLGQPPAVIAACEAKFGG